MAAIEIAAAGTTDDALIRLGGDGTAVGEFHEFTVELFMDVDSTVGGRCIARLTRPNALSGPTELTVQLDHDPGEVASVRIPLNALTVSTDPASENFLGVQLAWVSLQRRTQDAVVTERIRNALIYTRTRLLEFPANEREDVATWQIIADELAAEVFQKVVGGTMEVI